MIDNKLRITAGNTFATAHTITAQDVQGQPIPDFDLQNCTDIQVYARNGGSYKPVTSWQLDDQSVVVLWYGKQMKLGGYDFYIAGKFGGADWRTSEATIFEIVQYNEEANIPADTIVVDGTYFIDASFSLITEIQGGGGGTPSSTLPLMDGTASVGTENAYARGDHVHPSDTSKQDVISDLATIRSGAAAGATAVQPAELSGYQPLIDNDNKLDYSLLDNTPTIPAAQVNSDWNANSGVAQILNKPAIPAAQVQSDWDEVDTDSKAYIQNKPTIPAAQVQSDWNEADNTKADYIKNKPTIPSIAGLENTSNKVTSLSSASTNTQYPSAKCVYDGLGGKQDTIDSAHKLDYSLLDNTPTIPAAQVNSDWNANSGVAQILNKPTIPAAGIPAGGNAGQVLTKTDGSTDYAVAWRDTNNIFPSAYCTTAAATAAKAASCTLWTATANSYLHILMTKANSNQGALTLNVNSTGAAPIYINGSVSSSTNYTLPAGSYIVFYDGTNYYFRTDGKLTANITGTADGVSLGSLTDVSTTGATNGQVLGYNGSSWEPTNAGGGGDTPIVNHGTSDTTFAVTPNTLHIWGEVASLTLTLATPTDATIVNEYMFEFTSGSTATTLSLPATVEWAESCGSLSVEASKTYQVSIVNNIGLWASISNS